MSVPNVPTSPRVASLAAVAGIVLLTVAPVAAPAQQQAAPAATQAQPAAGAPKVAPSPKTLATWRGKVLAHLNSRKRESASADGTSTVAFSIDRSGKVVSARILASSGNKALDEEAVALTQRASPVPAPPGDITGSTLQLTVPIRFKR